jgi:general stress protein YciG
MANEQRGGSGNFANDPQRASEAGQKGGQQSHGGQQNQSGGQGGQQGSGGQSGGQQQQGGQGSGQQGGSRENNPGNFANDREKASEAGRKGGQS